MLGLTALTSPRFSPLGLTALRLFGAEAASGLGPGQLGAHPRSRLGWEVEGGAAWDVQSDGQLLQLVQAAAGARQVGWSRRALALLAGGGSCAPRVGRGAASPLGAGSSLPRAVEDAFAPR